MTTKIEWTEETWNPIVGCSIVSPGCTNCYAMRMAARIERMGSGRHYAGTTKTINGKAVWTGKLALAQHTLLAPLQRRTPTVYFVNSMGDLFHEDCPSEWIDRVFAVMALCPQHTFQVLTKRSERMREYLIGLPDHYQITERWSMAALDITESPCVGHIADVDWPLPNVWLGVSAERQQEADERIPDLLATPAAVRFVSAEPLLGPIDFRNLQLTHDALRPYAICGGRTGPNLDWIIVGGESGSDARPMHPNWARAIRDQCQAAGTPFFFKQWGAWQPFQPPMVYDESWERSGNDVVAINGAHSTGDKLNYGRVRPVPGPLWCRIRRLGKKAAGRILDGREWNEMPPPQGYIPESA